MFKITLFLSFLTDFWMFQIVIDQQNLPIYIHCLDGRRITGLFVLLLRRLQGYIPEFSSAEFWRFLILSFLLLYSPICSLISYLDFKPLFLLHMEKWKDLHVI